MYETEERASVPGRPGAVDRLRDLNERLHHQIGVLSERLSPVLAPDSPLAAAIDRNPSTSEIETQCDLLSDAVERVVRLQDRLTI